MQVRAIELSLGDIISERGVEIVAIQNIEFIHPVGIGGMNEYSRFVVCAWFASQSEALYNEWAFYGTDDCIEIQRPSLDVKSFDIKPYEPTIADEVSKLITAVNELADRVGVER